MTESVVIAMSGGVDSSVAAALLKQQGYEVTGMMLRLWSETGREDSNRCCSPDSMAVARRVAAKLDIPFYAVDGRENFRASVVQAFLDGYAAGDTPNPCLVCNRLIRWGMLLEQATAMGAQFLATGHYVRSDRDEHGRVRLLRATDRSKDQSYVLHGLSQEQLSRSLFPVGALPKIEIRRLAEEFGLPSARRPDSQDLCFLAGGDYRDFLRRNAPGILEPGEIADESGAVLGRHSGLPNYTIGQRKGLGLASSQPMYVIDKDANANRLIVGDETRLGSTELTAANPSWISGEAPAEPFQAEVKVRYTARETPAQVSLLEDGSRCRVEFAEPVRGVTPGQAAVFYNGEVVLGGGTILSKV